MTVAQYRRYVDVMRAQGKAIEMPASPYNEEADREDYPIVNVTWKEAMDYCKWAGVSLPTDEQWEKAATWDDIKKVKVLVPWGDDVKRLQRAYGYGPDAVGTFGISPYGCTDMAGNVKQWCRDREKPGSDQRVTRGANSRTADKDLIRADRRWWENQETRSPEIGFRSASSP